MTISAKVRPHLLTRQQHGLFHRQLPIVCCPLWRCWTMREILSVRRICSQSAPSSGAGRYLGGHRLRSPVRQPFRKGEGGYGVYGAATGKSEQEIFCGFAGRYLSQPHAHLGKRRSRQVSDGRRISVRQCARKVRLGKAQRRAVPTGLRRQCAGVGGGAAG